jgi:hypothetical protein
MLTECAVDMPTYLAPEILEKNPFDTRGTFFSGVFNKIFKIFLIPVDLN